jgi:hypothetical protein
MQSIFKQRWQSCIGVELIWERWVGNTKPVKKDGRDHATFNVHHACYNSRPPLKIGKEAQSANFVFVKLIAAIESCTAHDLVKSLGPGDAGNYGGPC